MNTAGAELREFVQANLNGQCKIVSVGEECTCALCNLDRLIEALAWYGDEARAIARNLGADRNQGVAASITVLSLDAGTRAQKVIG